jgi:hypothetical protein
MHDFSSGVHEKLICHRQEQYGGCRIILSEFCDGDRCLQPVSVSHIKVPASRITAMSDVLEKPGFRPESLLQRHCSKYMCTVHFLP